MARAPDVDVGCGRCGSLVLLTHDCGDICLELAKMLHYARLDTACDATFGLFLCVWTATRLGVFPTWIFYRLQESLLTKSPVGEGFPIAGGDCQIVFKRPIYNWTIGGL